MDKVQKAISSQCYRRQNVLESQSSAEVKNEWSYYFVPPICLHGVDTDNLTLTYQTT